MRFTLTLYWTPAPGPFLVSGHSFLYWYCSFRNPSWPISSALRQPMLLTISRLKATGHSQGLPICSPAPQTPTRGCSHLGLPNPLADHFTFPSSTKLLLPFALQTRVFVFGVLSSFLSHSSSSLLLILSLTHKLKKKKKPHIHTPPHTTSKRRAGTVYFHLFQVPAQFESISD